MAKYIENVFEGAKIEQNENWRDEHLDDKNSVDTLLEDEMYYAISFGILDKDNNILYYYEYDK